MTREGLHSKENDVPNRRNVLRGLAAIVPLPFVAQRARAIPGDAFCKNRCGSDDDCPVEAHCDDYGMCVPDDDPCAGREDGRVLLSCNTKGKFRCCKGQEGGPFGHARGTNCRGIRRGN